MKTTRHPDDPWRAVFAYRRPVPGTDIDV